MPVTQANPRFPNVAHQVDIPRKRVESSNAAVSSTVMRMTRRVPIVQFVATVKAAPGSASEGAETARTTVLSWLRDKQRIELPACAWSGDSFEIDASEGMPLEAVGIGNFWALQFDKFDADIPGRVWRTEASVAFSDSTAIVGIRLALIDSVGSREYFPSVPLVVRNLIRSPGLVDYGFALSDKPWLVASEPECDRLLRLLELPTRTRPVVVFATGQDVDAFSDAASAATRLAGLAHVCVVDENRSRLITGRLGGEFSVWNGAIRTYNPAFNPLVDEVAQHPPATRAWLHTRFSSIDHFTNVLLRSFAARTVRDPRLEDELPPFRSIKNAAISNRISSLPTQGNSERERLLELEVDLLKQTVQEKAEEYNFADAEVKILEAERDRYRAQLGSVRVRIDVLESKLKEEHLAIDHPDSLVQLDVWVQEHFPDRLVVMNRAIRAARKSPFADPQLVYRSLEVLARGYVDARRSGQTIDDLFSQVGVHLERTGDPATLAQWREQYFVPHRGRDRFLEWHLKKGSDKNEVNTMRIYFFYDEDDEVVVVGHLPGHLTNEKS
jgi:hypothetical protein